MSDPLGAWLLVVDQRGAPMSSGTFTITPRGPFSLAEAAAFGFGQRDAQGRDGCMRLAFCLDGYQAHVGVEVRQAPPGDTGAAEVHGMFRGPADVDPDAVRRQVARVLSLDHDGAEFLRVGERGPVIRRVQPAAARGSPAAPGPGEAAGGGAGPPPAFVLPAVRATRLFGAECPAPAAPDGAG